MEAYWGSGGIAPRLLDLATDGGEWSASRPGRFTSGKGPLIPIGQEAGWAPESGWRVAVNVLNKQSWTANKG